MGIANAEKKQRYVNIFDDMNADWETIVDTRDTKKETDFASSVLSKKKTILDLCCGTGRHSIILSKKGFSTIGLDLSKNLLAIARQRMKKANVNLPLVRADMRYFPFKEQVFEAVICMFTSLGYLPSESEDMKNFLEVHRTLRKSGQFLLDVANKDHITRIFRKKEWAEFKEFYMLEKRSLDLKTLCLRSQWTIIRKDTKKVRILMHVLRLYSITRLKRMLRQADLSITDVYGGYDKKEFNSESSRMIVLATRKTT